MEKKLYYGCAYYPELWEKEEVDKDIRHMKELGINVVRMGEFAWSFLEPHEGEFHMEFFVWVMKKLYDNGIQTILCTPTATPPVWLTNGYPGRLFLDREGNRLSHGSRQHVCIGQDYIKEKAQIIAAQMAQAAGNLQGLAGWQIDNELKCHVAECFCESCICKWHGWLEKKYGEIDVLNHAWGTDIWSQRYQSFEQIPAPVKTPFLHNPSLEQSYRLFSMKQAEEFIKIQADAIRRYSNQPITHNTGETFSVDTRGLFQNLDFASFDDYAEAKDYKVMLRSYDYFRMVKHGVPFWVMETSPNHNGSTLGMSTPHPRGYLKAEVASAYILGALGFSYWLFRQQRAGCEMPHGSILYAWGSPSTGYLDVKEAGAIKDKLEPWILKTKLPKAKVALLYSELARVNFDIEPMEGYQYWNMIQAVYEDDIPKDIAVDLIHEETPLEGYELLYTPFMAFISEKWLKKAQDYVRSGGTWIAGPMCGFRTAEHTVPLQGGMGDLEIFAGARVRFMQNFTGAKISGQAFGNQTELSMLSCTFTLDDAKALGVITQGSFAEEVFLTERYVGKGRMILAGSRPALKGGSTFMRDILSRCLRQEEPRFHTVSNIKAVVRRGEQMEGYVFAVEMEGKEGSIEVFGDYQVIYGERSENGVNVKPYETVLVLLK